MELTDSMGGVKSKVENWSGISPDCQQPAMENLSIAANAFAVVGLVDIVFRFGMEGVDLYSRCCNALKNVSRLVANLKTLADIVAKVRALIDEYN